MTYLSLVEKGGFASFEPLLLNSCRNGAAGKKQNLMMIKSFFSAHLLIASLVVGGLWLLVVWLFCFRRKTTGSSPPLKHRWQKGVDDLGTSGLSDADDLMGKPVLEEGVTVVSAEEFSFAKRPDQIVVEAASKTEQLGLIADVQQEIKSVCAVLAQKDGTKEDFFSMFELVRVKYPKMTSHPALPELRLFIRERVPFHLSDEELDGLWS
jgi:hypothetical protein